MKKILCVIFMLFLSLSHCSVAVSVAVAVSVSGEGGDETMENNNDEYVTITAMKDSHAMALAKQSTNRANRANV